jgi:hypothetical protein
MVYGWRHANPRQTDKDSDSHGSEGSSADAHGVLPVLTPLLIDSLAGRLFADVRDCRPARRVYRQFYRQRPVSESTLTSTCAIHRSSADSRTDTPGPL